jgi:hypothetical protein
MQLNTYSINLQLTAVNEQPAFVAVALERIKAFVLGEMANVLFINAAHDTVAEMFDALGTNICTLPEEPYDQIVGLMLLYKLTAITEGHVLISQLDISSSLGDELWYQFDQDSDPGVFAHEGWWHNRGCVKHVLHNDHDNVVKVDTLGWKEYDLEWPDTAEGASATIVKPDFKRHETHNSQ